MVRTGRHKCMCFAELASMFPLLYIHIDFLSSSQESQLSTAITA